MSFAHKQALITGGGTGIGRGLAEAFVRQGIRVIITGRRAAVLEEVCKANPGMQHYALDLTDRAALQHAAEALPQKFGPIDCLVNNAGVQRMHEMRSKVALDFCDLEIDSNLRALLACTAAFLPHLQQQQSASIVNVTSGLAFVPLARMPVYCATKAAVHSFTLSLRHQLRDSKVRVIELAPPAVSTELHDYMGPKGRDIGIPLADFVRDAMAGLNAGGTEIWVGDAKQMHDMPVDQLFARMNAG